MTLVGGVGVVLGGWWLWWLPLVGLGLCYFLRGNVTRMRSYASPRSGRVFSGFDRFLALAYWSSISKEEEVVVVVVVRHSTHYFPT